MEIEKLIIKFKLPNLNNLAFVDEIVTLGYKKTFNKFWVSFNGSKGYLCNIEIGCEGSQESENRIFLHKYRNKDNSLKSVMVNVFFSEKNGIRISTGNDKPKKIYKSVEVVNSKKDDDDLPF